MGNPDKIYQYGADPTINLGDITFDPLPLPQFGKNALDVTVLRLDKIHPEISGNKWFKLKYYLEAGKLRKRDRLISFGGPYSNHLVALACAARAQGFSSTGFIRGEKPAIFSASLFTAMKYGMDLEFLPRSVYSLKEDRVFLSELQSRYPRALIIPEGGCGEPGIRGAGEILTPGVHDYSHICCAVGTGTTITGLLKARKPHQKMIGIPVLKGTQGIEPLRAEWITDKEKENSLVLFHEYHFGGYAKKTPALLDFMNSLFERSGIPTDFVYTGKLFYAIADLAFKNYFPKGSSVLILHSGGLQGNLSLAGDVLHF